MKEIKDLTDTEIKNALWRMSCGGLPEGIVADKDALRRELYGRTGELLGYHEEPYKNEGRRCECIRCERNVICVYRDRYQRHPRDLAPGALGLCPKLEAI